MTASLSPRLAAKTLLLATVTSLAAAPASAQEPSAVQSQPSGMLTQVARFEHQVTGVTVAKDGRIFVNFPRWTEDAPVSVAELKDGKPVAYPDAEWNSWRNARKDQVDPKTHFVCVQSVVADAQDRLWVVDAAAPAMAATVKDGPKLVAIDLKTDTVAKTIPFDDTVAPQGSYLNDVRIAPDGKTAYLTDSGAEGALIVVDIDSGKARRLLAGHASTMPDKAVTVTYDGKPLRRPDGRGVEFSADGIALSPDGKTLYWQAIKGRMLYSLPTDALTGWATAAIVPEALTDRSLAGKIATVGEHGPDVRDLAAGQRGEGARPLGHQRRPHRAGPGRAAALARHLRRGAGRHALRHDLAHPGLGLLQGGRAGGLADRAVADRRGAEVERRPRRSVAVRANASPRPSALRPATERTREGGR